MSEIQKLYGYHGANPFLDINGRDFSDEAIQEEFCPTTQFWSLFNSQHEILIGTRGCGKTFLLKTMRRSMLQKIDDPQASEIVSQKKYIAFYIALQMERMANIENVDRSDEEKIALFRFIFNSCLAISIVSEAIKYCKDLGADNKQQALVLNSNLADRLYKVWFNGKTNDEIIDLDDLIIQINKLYFNFNFAKDSIDEIPSLFISDLCAPLSAAATILSKFWDADEPTWILAIDEAEFVNELYQKIINSFMRSNPLHIILKIATLPYYWTTLETLNDNIEISSGNDFNYKMLDMDSESNDFKELTNKLCTNRLKRIVWPNSVKASFTSLDSFLGTIGNDSRLDYFRNEMKGISDDEIRKGIFDNLSEARQNGSASKGDLFQTIYKKYAPIYYVREIYKKKKGRYIPEWFAGSDVVRKITQGNPRMFINLMSQFFSYAISHSNFSLKDQHQVIVKYAHSICEATKAIEKDGEIIYKNLTNISEQLHHKTHEGNLKEVGCSFTLKKEDILNGETDWIKRAISFSRLSVDESTIKNGITINTKYVICNAFAVEYWLTMRSDYPTNVTLANTSDSDFADDQYQISLFSEGLKDEKSDPKDQY